MPPRVVITGLGMVTPLGPDVESTWSGLMEGRSAVAPITRFDASEFPVRFAAQSQDPGPLQGRGEMVEELKGRLARSACLQALAQSGLSGGARVGVSLGSEASRPPLDMVGRRLRDGQLPDAGELRRMAPQAPTRWVAQMAGAEGPMSTISTACTSSSQAIGEGMLRIRRGEVDAMVVGGVDVLVDPIMVTGFALLGALSTRNDDPEAASRPFDKGRDGFVLGEGAGMMVLESEAHARARGAEILGEIVGYGCSCNAYRITDSPPNGRGAAQAMSSALRDAGLAPEAVGYINAHGTSTSMNDPSESRGIRSVFGAHTDRLAVSSTKSMMGHLVAACGVVEAIVTLLAVNRGRLPPTINLDDPDPECDLDHIRHQPRTSEIEYGLTNAFGFGGSNGSLVFSSWREDGR
jgi:3-oxoacyl-[acyl-carrier-protein] synthase II